MPNGLPAPAKIDRSYPQRRSWTILDDRMLTRTIASSGEALPVIGIGTYKGFDVGSGSKERAALGGVLRNLFSFGGSVLDSSPMYGRAEEVVGDLLAAQRVMTQKTFERVRRIELQLGVEPSHYEANPARMGSKDAGTLADDHPQGTRESERAVEV